MHSFLSVYLPLFPAHAEWAHTHNLQTVDCWKSARIVDPLVAEGIEVCWHVKDGGDRRGDVLILPKGLYKTLPTSL